MPSRSPSPELTGYDLSTAGRAKAVGYPAAFEEGKIQDGEVLRFVKV